MYPIKVLNNSLESNLLFQNIGRSGRLSKTLWEKGQNADTSISSFFHNVFYYLTEAKSYHFNNICHLYSRACLKLYCLLRVYYKDCLSEWHFSLFQYYFSCIMAKAHILMFVLAFWPFQQLGSKRLANGHSHSKPSASFLTWTWDLWVRVPHITEPWWRLKYREAWKHIHKLI